MSEIKVNSIKGVGASAAAITVNNTDGTCTANITNNLSNRNKIYNGKMDVDQRNSGSSVTLTNNLTTYTVDRFAVQPVKMDEALNMTVQQVEDAPDGFVHSLKITTNTAESAIASDEFVSVYQKMEGQDFQDLAYGVSGAKNITMSFYVKSSITGTFSFTVYRDESTDRIINKTYTINSANTWERKTISIAGDTTNSITNDNTARWWNTWHLAAGSDYDSVTSSTWANYTTTNWAGGQAQDGVITTAGATWQITGVQLEVDHTESGVATDFEHRSFGQELALCERYCETILQGETDGAYIANSVAYTTNQMYAIIRFRTPKRATNPTLYQTTGTDYYRMFRDGNNVTATGFTGTSWPNKYATGIYNSMTITAGQAGLLGSDNSNAIVLIISEL